MTIIATVAMAGMNSMVCSDGGARRMISIRKQALGSGVYGKSGGKYLRG
jgi:hypothetical protein